MNQQKTATMKSLPKEERPYEKCLEHGPESLTEAELLSVIIRTGARGKSSLDLSRSVLEFNSHGGLTGLLHLSVPQLKEIHGIGTVKAIQLVCIGELSKRIWRTLSASQLILNSPESIADYYMESMRHLEQEQVAVAMFNTKNMLLKDVILSKGTVNASLVSPREVFLEALRYHAVYIVLIHNHPSGDPTPSGDDLMLTQRLKEAGLLIGIELIDHIIIGDNRYISLKERGIL